MILRAAGLAPDLLADVGKHHTILHRTLQILGVEKRRENRGLTSRDLYPLIATGWVPRPGSGLLGELSLVPVP